MACSRSMQMLRWLLASDKGTGEDTLCSDRSRNLSSRGTLESLSELQLRFIAERNPTLR
jgi:hypothetical protein